MADFDETKRQLNLLTDDDLIKILREHDEEQWRPEVFDIVASLLGERGVAPIMNSDNKDSADTSADTEEFSDEPVETDLITVASYTRYVEAETSRLALEAAGLRTWIFNEHVPGMIGPIGGGVQLRVSKKDSPAATAILNSEPVSSSHLPDEIAEPPCPKCGSRKVTEEAEIVESADESSGYSRSCRPEPRQVWLYKCGECGHSWADS
jgi:hypothetical protein